MWHERNRDSHLARQLISFATGLVVLAGMAVSPAWAGGKACAEAAAAEAARAAESARPDDPRPDSPKPLIQLAILLDTSNSMDGLINQAKSQLWQIVNTLAVTKQKGQRPELRVALYEYGNDGLSAGEGYIRQVLPFIDELDKVSEKLFALRTNGGSEYCAQVIRAATEGLTWSGKDSDLKIIVIAGNEPFTQGTVDYHTTVPAAARKGIVINTIFCGNKEEGEQTGWSEGARIGNGTYGFINSEAQMRHIPCPQDGRISELGEKLNTTYIAYGDEGRTGLANQVAQDSNAKVAPGAPAGAAMVDRAVSKSSRAYRNTSWDLVDAVKEKKVKLEDVKDKELPAEMQPMTPAQRESHLNKLAAEREAMQKEIGELQRQREVFIAEKQKELGGKDETLAGALLTAIRAQATRQGFTFDK